MTDTPEVQPLTHPILTSSISFTQADGKLKVLGVMVSDDAVTNTMIHLDWPELPALNSYDNVGTWLYGCLAQLSLHFDEHSVTSAENRPSHLCEEHSRG